jgi:hypothetical protein
MQLEGREGEKGGMEKEERKEGEREGGRRRKEGREEGRKEGRKERKVGLIPTHMPRTRTCRWKIWLTLRTSNEERASHAAGEGPVLT